jgi:hypothetical protein
MNLKAVNELFVTKVFDSGCDILVLNTLACVSLFLFPLSIKRIQLQGVKVVCVFGDDEYMLNRHAHWVERFDKCVAYVRWCADYYNNIVPGSTYYLPLGSYFPELETPNLEGDVVFVGSPFTDQEGERPTHLRALIEAGVDVTIYGPDGWSWMHGGFFKEYWKGYLSPKDVVKTIRKYKISLAFLGDHIDGSAHMNNNIWTSAAAEVACFCSHYEPLFSDYKFKEGENIVTFKDKIDLSNKIKTWLSAHHILNSLGKNLHKHVKENFNFVDLYKKFLKELEAL